MNHLQKHIYPITSVILLLMVLLLILSFSLVACQPTPLEPVALNQDLANNPAVNITSTPTPNMATTPFFANQPQEEVVWDGHIDIYGNILQGYNEALGDPNLPYETLVAMVWEMATIESEATLIAMPIPTDDPDFDLDSFAATAESFNATAIAIMDLTYTPQPTYAPLMGILYAPAEDALPLSPRSATHPNSAWRGYVNGQSVFLQIGRVNNVDGERVGFIDFRSSNNSGFYESPILLGNTLTFRLIDVISDQYLVIEAYEEGLLSEWHWTGGTGEMYYFDMVAREFMAQPTAELWIENFPGGGGNTLQAQPTLQPQATPTPPIALTISPINPTLHWNTQHTEECWASGGWAIPAELFPRGSGQEMISPEIISTYYLTCFNPVVHTTAWTAPNTGSPSVMSTFTANTQTPLFTTPNTPIALQWSVSYYSGQTCQASGAWSGTKALFGSENIASLPIGKHLFTLTCQKETLSVLVVVEEAPAPPPPTATPTLLPTATPTLTPLPTNTPTPTAAPPLAIKINFQPSGAVVPVGYVVDSGQVYGPRGNGLTYGWDIDITATARDRNNALSADQQHDTLVHLQLWPGPYPTKWELELPNGQYQVRLVAGDPVYINSSYRISAEGLSIINGNPTLENRWFDNTITVTVSDGKLTLTSGAGANNNKINFIEIQAVAP